MLVPTFLTTYNINHQKDGYIRCASTDNCNFEEYELDGGLYTNDEKWIVMLSSGLRDKNNIEIYEKDTIKITPVKPNELETINNIVFINGTFGYFQNYVFVPIGQKIKWIDGQSNNVEVIGNIYELSPSATIDESITPA